MDLQTLGALEEAIKPYRQAGYVITSQSEGAITLTHPPEKFSCLIFLFALALFWPAAIAYIIFFNNRIERTACVRITAQGQIEAIGYTLEAARRERKREHWIILSIAAVIALIIIAVSVLLLIRYSARM
ncbi:MAG TPA: hypothetical protein VF544_08270 [Pyrinomonadaceae bacterium]